MQLQTINNLIQLSNEIIKIKVDPRFNYFAAFYEKHIVLYYNDEELISILENNTGLDNFEMNFENLKIINYLAKNLKTFDFKAAFESEFFEETYEILVRPGGNEKKIKTPSRNEICLNLYFNNKKYSFTKLEIKNRLDKFAMKNININNYELLGKLDKKQITKFISIFRSLVIDLERKFSQIIYIQNNEFYITDSYEIINNVIDFKNCILNFAILKEFSKSDFVEIYQNENKMVYKSNNLVKTEEIDLTRYNFVELIKNLYTKTINNKFEIDFTKVYELRNSKYENITLNLLDNTFILQKEIDYDNNTILSYNLDSKMLQIETNFEDYYLQFNFKKFIHILQNCKDIKKVIVKYSKNYKPIEFDQNILMPIRISDYTIELVKNVKRVEISQITEVKEITKVKEIKPKTQAKTMDLKKEKIVKAPVSKYKKNIENEVKNEVKNEIVVYTPVIENDPVEVVNEVELSKTTVGPKFDIIDFIYMHCANELENLNYYNTDYRNNKLYLENFEFGFRSLENKIEVIELDYELNTKDYYFENKKDLLKFVRSKIEFDYNLTH